MGYGSPMNSGSATAQTQAPSEEGLTVFRYKLKPMRDHQWSVIQQSLGCQRWVYNQGVALQESLMEAGEKRLPYKDLCKALTGWKKDQGWLGNGPSQALQQTLSGLIRGYQAWRQSPEHFSKPTFKKKSQRRESLTFPTPSHLTWDRERGRITLPKIGQLRYFKDQRKPDGVLRRASITWDGNYLVICFTVKQDSSTVREPSDIAKACGLDWGVVNRVTLDDGTVFDFPEDTIQALDKAIAKTQRWISHKVEMRKQVKAQIKRTLKEGLISAKERQILEEELNRRGESKTLQALRAKLRKLHQRRRNVLNNARHQITATIAAEHGTVYLEATQAKAMTASAKGTQENPGKNVKQKAGLNRQILVTAPGELRRQLEYKTARHGGKVILVNPAYSSRTCPACDHESEENRPTRDRFACTHCGFAAPADQVGAINVKRWGQAGTHLAPVKQYKTRPALISRKPKESLAQDSLHPTRTSPLVSRQGLRPCPAAGRTQP